MNHDKAHGRTDSQSIEVKGQMDPDTVAELLRPWRGDGRTRGPALELVLKNGRMIVPKPITASDASSGNGLKEDEAIYVLTINGERDGVEIRMTIIFLGAITLLDELDNRWKEPGEWQSHNGYAGLRFRGYTRHIIGLKPLVSEYVPVTITLTQVLEPNTVKNASDLASVGGHNPS